jgi:uncharacterized protein HemX
MNFSAEGIAAIIVALAGLVSGVYNLMQARRVQAVDERDKAEKERDSARNEQREAERLLELAMRHIHTLNLLLARHGVDEVPMPKALE